MHANTPDALLLDHWRTRRDADAFAELVARYGPLVYSACLRVLRSSPAAGAAAQDCFLELLQSRARVHSLPGFLHTTATRRAVDRLRSERSRADREARFAAAQPITIEATWDDVSAYVDEAIAALPDKLQRPVVLRFLQGRSYAEIASDTGLPASTIQYQLKQGIEGIRKHLAGRGLPISAAALSGMLAAAPSQAMPVAATAQIGAMALAGGGASVVLVTGSTWGGLLSVKSVLTALALLAVAGMPAAYVLTHDELPAVVQTSNAPFAGALEATETIAPILPQAAEPLASLASQVDAAQADAGATVSGTVLHAGDSTAQDVLVAMDWNGESWFDQSDAEGRFEIPLPPGFGSGNDSTSATLSLGAEKDMLRAFPMELEATVAGLSGITLKLESTGTFSGHVVDTEGNPLAGWTLWATGPKNWTNTKVNEQGEFSIAGLRQGDYTLHATDTEGRRTNYEGGRAITLLGGLTYTGITLVWPESGLTLSSHVLGEDGTPIAGARVGAYFPQQVGEGEELVQVGAESDADGRYALAGFPSVAELEVTLQVSQQFYMQASRVGVRLEGQEEDITLVKRTSIRGQVLDVVTRKPVASFRTNTWIGRSEAQGFRDEDGLALSNNWDQTENEDGAFAILASGYGDVRVAVAAPGYVTAVKTLADTAPGAVIEGEKIMLEPARPIAGMVVDEAGAPIADARIFFGFPLYPSKDSHLTMGWEGITETNDAGEFTLTEYPPVLSIVSAYHDEYALGWTEVKEATPIRIVLSKGAVVEGAVSLFGIPLGSKRANVNYDAGDNGISMAYINDDGRYRFEKVPTGWINLSVGFHEGDVNRDINRKIHIEPGKSTRQDFDFADLGASYIEGVLLLDEQPVPNSLLRTTATLENGDTISYQGSARGDGTFRLGPIPAGDYEFGALWIQLTDGSYLSPDAESLLLQEGETLKHDLLYTSR